MKSTPLTRREMLGLLAVTAAGSASLSLMSCESKPKLVASAAGLPLHYGESQTGIAVPTGSEKHTLFGHPESRARTDAILKTLQERQADGSLPRLHRLEERIATTEELSRVHSNEYILRVRNATQAGTYLSDSRWAPYGGPFAFSAAASAAGSALALLHAIDRGRIRNGFSLSRPPGHHAGRDHSAGYCIFNNVAVAVRSLLETKQRRIAIVDFDVHHGDGIQDCFYHDANVLYISTHQDDWPFTGKLEMTGEGPGRGKNINIPLPLHTGDDGLLQANEQVVLPALRRFKPEMIVVAAGFDGHWRDPQGSFELSISGLTKISQRLNEVAKELCDGKIAYVLEGGYQLEVLGCAAANIFSLLNPGVTANSKFPDPFGRSTSPIANVTETIRKVRKIHKL
jgi:acetoin utilization deacetylase AcuC-like enzyme